MAELLYIRIVGVEELAKKLKELTKITDPDFVVDEAGAILLNRIRTRFLDETDPDGIKWIPSQAALTGTGRARKGKSFKTLFDTGDLFRSIQLARIGPGVKAIGTDIPYGKYHQFGTERLPVRRFLGFNQEDADVVAKLIADRINKDIA